MQQPLRTWLSVSRGGRIHLRRCGWVGTAPAPSADPQPDGHQDGDDGRKRKQSPDHHGQTHSDRDQCFEAGVESVAEPGWRVIWPTSQYIHKDPGVSGDIFQGSAFGVDRSGGGLDHDVDASRRNATGQTPILDRLAEGSRKELTGFDPFKVTVFGCEWILVQAHAVGSDLDVGEGSIP